ncbi:MAG: hypothetical protein IJU19_02995 [Bacteroidales bacterium]|nr:hypothetical protein [Bacteroidales bacterium]
MFDFETSVSGIEYKVRQLADEVERLRRQVAESGHRCEVLQKALDEKEEQINQLKEENSIVKLGTRLAEKEDDTELKIRINQMIRTIDRSLGILKGDGMSE